MRRVEEEGGSYPGGLSSSGRAGRIGDGRHESGVGTTGAGAGRRRTGVALAVIRPVVFVRLPNPLEPMHYGIFAL